jgi:hypothetical protein
MDQAAVVTLAEELLPCDAGEELRTIVEELDVLARFKYDRYDGYAQGCRFWEHTIAWLRRFEPCERAAALRLLRRQLVFVSRDELLHLIRCAYPDFLRPALLRRLAREEGDAAAPLSALVRTSQFDELRRSIVVVGLSDGARLDLLRRAVPELASTQFVLDPGAGVYGSVRHVVAVDDFSGTGRSLIRREGARFAGRLSELSRGLPPNVSGTLLVYVASRRAVHHLRRVVPEAFPGWDVVIVQELPGSDRGAADSGAARELLWRHYGVEPSPDTKDGNMGYRAGELPLVLHHNTPNDSLALLWMPPNDGPWSATALFPRCERLRAGRDQG